MYVFTINHFFSLGDRSELVAYNQKMKKLITIHLLCLTKSHFVVFNLDSVTQMMKFHFLKRYVSLEKENSVYTSGFKQQEKLKKIKTHENKHTTCPLKVPLQEKSGTRHGIYFHDFFLHALQRVSLYPKPSVCLPISVTLLWLILILL